MSVYERTLVGRWVAITAGAQNPLERERLLASGEVGINAGNGMYAVRWLDPLDAKVRRGEVTLVDLSTVEGTVRVFFGKDELSAFALRLEEVE